MEEDETKDDMEGSNSEIQNNSFLLFFFSIFFGLKQDSFANVSIRGVDWFVSNLDFNVIPCVIAYILVRTPFASQHQLPSPISIHYKPN